MQTAQTVYGQERSFNELCTEIASKSTISHIDVEAVLQAFITTVVMEVTNSRSVCFGDLGSLFLTMRSEQVFEPELFNRSKIRKVRYSFRPGAAVRRLLREPVFELVSDKRADAGDTGDGEENDENEE